MTLLFFFVYVGGTRPTSNIGRRSFYSMAVAEELRGH
jgi:hypothetical protein